MATRGRSCPDRRHSNDAAQRWAALLLERLRVAATAAEREQLLRELDQPYLLGEDDALALYRIAGRSSSEFIRRHAPRGRRAEDARLPWSRMMREAMGHGDEDLYFALYRAQVPPDQWARETLELARRIANPEVLCAELNRRHPQRWRADIAPHLHALAQRRGEHILPYLQDHSAQIWSTKRRAGAKEMADLARLRGWWGLWGTLAALSATPADYDELVATVIGNHSTPEMQVRQQLLQLASGADTKGTRLHLKDATLLALYRRFPHYVSGPFRAQLAVSVRRPRTAVLQLAIEQHDEEVVDLLATQLAAYQPRSGDSALIETARLAAAYYAQLGLHGTPLAARVGRILKRIPPGTIRGPAELERRNPLAELLFGVSRAALLTNQELLAELLGARNRYVVSLALQTLGDAGMKASGQINANLEALLATAARPFERPALGRLLRVLAATSSESTARLVLEWTREQLSQATSSASIDSLAGLAGALLQRFPRLRSSIEQPVVYRRRAA